ncbi:MAG: DUF4912 domain-containing protein [Pseudomonadota bacterium]
MVKKKKAIKKKIVAKKAVKKVEKKAVKKPAKKVAKPDKSKKSSRKKVLISKARTLKKKAAKKISPKKSVRKKRTLKLTKIEPLLKDIQLEHELTEQRKIEESKFNIGVPENAQAIPLYELPGEYHKDRAVILTISPDFVFAYWGVCQQSMQDAISKIGHNAKLTLRFYDISQVDQVSNAPCWDVEVFDRLGNWYLRLDYPEQKLYMEVGLKNEAGYFYNLSHSNIIKLPRRFIAPPKPLKWMVVSPDGQKVITDIEEYTEADLELLKKILGPHFFDLLMKGKFSTISGSNLEAVFQEISSLRNLEEVSSSPTQWSK